MRVLAIDPGYGRCGMAIVEKKNGKETLLYSECIETSSATAFPERLAAVVSACSDVIRSHKPDAFAIEKLYFTKNQKTAMQVAEVRGALIATAAAAGIPVTEYTPGQVKSATTGYGNSDKHAVARMLHTLLVIEKKIQHDDEYDAIAIGITHLASAR